MAEKKKIINFNQPGMVADLEGYVSNLDNFSWTKNKGGSGGKFDLTDESGTIQVVRFVLCDKFSNGDFVLCEDAAAGNDQKGNFQVKVYKVSQISAPGEWKQPPEQQPSQAPQERRDATPLIPTHAEYVNLWAKTFEALKVLLPAVGDASLAVLTDGCARSCCYPPQAFPEIADNDGTPF